IHRRNAELNKPFLMFDTATTFLLSYRGPRPPIGPPIRVVIPVLCVGAALAMLLTSAMYPRRRSQGDHVIAGDDAAKDPDALSPAAQRGGLWLAARVLLPASAFDCVACAEALP